MGNLLTALTLAVLHLDKVGEKGYTVITCKIWNTNTAMCFGFLASFCVQKVLQSKHLVNHHLCIREDARLSSRYCEIVCCINESYIYMKCALM